MTVTDAIQVVEEVLRYQAAGETSCPPRLSVESPHGWLRVMPAAVRPWGVMGFKTFNLAKAVGLRYLNVLFDSASGELLALLDGDLLTTVRTGATSAVAARYLAPSEVEVAGVIGSGAEARMQLRALHAVRPVRRVFAYSPTPEHRTRFALEMEEELGIPVRAVASPDEAVRGAGLVITATTSWKGLPVLCGEWLSPGAHLSAIGSTVPQLREIDSETFRRSGLVVVDSREQALRESGDVIAAVGEGAVQEKNLIELWEVFGRGEPVSRNPDQITLFKSVGTAIQDLAVSYLAFRLSLERDVGLEVDDLLALKAIH
jgi:ornithine cyclodeaminase/alanine dehydrogenase-like protein (mu-crystallin family)